jgi:5-methylcytosine-specific restriction protein B
MSKQGFTWIDAHQKIADYLSDHRNDQPAIIQLLRDLEITALNDKDENDQAIELSEIDPFTFFCYLYKHGSEKNLTHLQRITERLGYSPQPTDIQGIPSANAQKVWLFPYKKTRTHNEVARLWTFFDAVRADTVTESLFNDVLSIKNVGLIKLTEALFMVKPEKYLPIDGPVRPWLLAQLGIDAKFKTWIEYLNILEIIRSKTDLSFPGISYAAWIARQESPIGYWIFQANPDTFDLVTAIQKNLLTTWSVTSHKNEIQSGDKVIIWATGKESGCYALAEVTGKPGPTQPAPDDHLWKVEKKTGFAVPIHITHDLSSAPLFWSVLKTIPDLEDFKAGNQGTNFMATESEYAVIADMAESARKPRTWLYAPGADAKYWDEFRKAGIMAIGWDELGPLTDYGSKEDIVQKLQILQETEKSKKNDATACWEFCNGLVAGDTVIVKKGRLELLGYGVIKGEYQFDAKREEFKHVRTMDWKAEGHWTVTESLALKTLTDISPYPGYPEQLMEIMTGSRIPTKKETTTRKQNQAINTILFGPPGTGKTFNTINKALSILQGIPVEQLNPDRQVLQEQFRQFQNDGRIGFVTFHPSFSYEDFVEGLKPVIDEVKGNLKYEIQPGIFKTMVVNAAYEYVQTLSPDTGRVTFEDRWDSFIEEIENKLSDGIEASFALKSGKKIQLVRISEKGNMILRHEGATTDQEYVVSRERTKKLYDTFHSVDDIENINTAVRSVIGGSNASAYWAVLKEMASKKTQGQKKNEPTAPTWEQKASRVSDLDWSEVDPDAQSVQPYVLIIDEINRGNIPAIFGELITLIEEDKRAGREEGLSLTLPYSKETFHVPANLYIVGTMNTADRSIEALDAALRRRFSFEPLYPQTEKLVENIDDVNIRAILEKINNRLERLLDRDHTIGHAFFIGAKSIDDLSAAFKSKVIPQLQEYFYGDFRKLGMILGKGLVVTEDLPADEWPSGFADEAEEAKSQVYRIKELKTQEEWKTALKSILA